MSENKTSTVERVMAMTQEELRKHLIAIGERIIGDAEKMNFPAGNTLSITITASINPGESVTTVQYNIDRYADPRVLDRE